MRYERGQVVLVDFPYSDQTGSKVRPALVVQADRWNRALDDTLLAMISSSLRRQVNADTQRLIRVPSAESAGSGLRMDSLIQCENLVTLDQGLVLTELGRLDPSVMADVDKCLKAALDL
jgi:mRNA interferase MazF